MVGGLRVKVEGEKRRKYPPTVSRQEWMSFFCREETSSGEAELGGDDCVWSEDWFVAFEVSLAEFEVGKGVARSSDARS